MKKLIYFILAVLITFTLVLMFNVFESKPFKFENFKTAEEGKAYLDEHYPLGSDISKILKDVSLAGAQCVERTKKIREKFEFEKVYECSYSNNFISLDPFSRYYLLFYVNKKNELVNVFLKKESKIEFP